ncbi:unnamed protein product [Vitrella brassicaformis CCMP3155]|uniref:Secreted protein n=1 Tax=Vitrella brassicaformis (strain CCMP3155) TaxID=1169540 RepID=A0A0G4G054_VITBC|nr:unnamed protein product [Vitrella brassicaformis CCMP3155]|eukprot:CEM21231.1 unnamed protein product [Vitrella brassicaformis CCMP3155]
MPIALVPLALGIVMITAAAAAAEVTTTSPSPSMASPPHLTQTNKFPPTTDLAEAGGRPTLTRALQVSPDKRITLFKGRHQIFGQRCGNDTQRLNDRRGGKGNLYWCSPHQARGRAGFNPSDDLVKHQEEARERIRENKQKNENSGGNGWHGHGHGGRRRLR